MEFVYRIGHAIEWFYTLIKFYLVTGCLWLIDHYMIFLEPWELGTLIFGPIIYWELWWWHDHRMPTK